MKNYEPRDWYWIVGGDETRIFSSASGNYVPADDAAFVAWQSDGTRPTRIDTEASLGEVLAPYRARPIHAGVLDGYLERQASDVVDAVQFKIMFNHENRIRALAGQPSITANQFRTALKALL